MKISNLERVHLDVERSATIVLNGEGGLPQVTVVMPCKRYLIEPSGALTLINARGEVYTSFASGEWKRVRI